MPRTTLYHAKQIRVAPPYDDAFWYLITPEDVGTSVVKDKGDVIAAPYHDIPDKHRLVTLGYHVEKTSDGYVGVRATRRMQAVESEGRGDEARANKERARTEAALARTAARTAARTQKAPKSKSRSRSRSPARSVTRRLPRLPAYEGYSKAAENAAFKEFRALGVGRRKPGQTAQVSPASRSRSRSRSPKAKTTRVKTARTKTAKTAKKSRSRSRSPGYVYIGDKRRRGMGEGAEGPALPYNYNPSRLFSRRRPRGSVTRVGSANLEAALARLRSTRRQRAPQEFVRRFTGRSASPLRGARTTYGAVGTVENPIRSEAATRIARFYRDRRPAAAVVVMGAPVMGAPQPVPRNSRNSESEEFFE
jgi:hypothetical protein